MTTTPRSKKQTSGYQKPSRQPSPDGNERPTDTSLPDVFLPGGTVRVCDAAQRLGKLLAATRQFFSRGGQMVRIDRNDGRPFFRPVKAAELPSILESVARLMKPPTGKSKRPSPAICSESTAKLLLGAKEFQDALPPIRVISPCPVLSEHRSRLKQISGYDRQTGIFAHGKRVKTVPLDQAVPLLLDLVWGFRFPTDGDLSRAIAGILSPALIHGGLLGGRAPVDLGEADSPQTGKGYRNKLTAAIYGCNVRAVTQRKGGVGGLEESFDSALVAGALFISLDNIRGKLDSQAIESFMTEDSYLARVPYSEAMAIDPKPVTIMLTSNRASLTEDFAKRASCVRILKQPEGYHFKRYSEGNILEHVRANQPLYLGAVFAVIREWHRRGKPRSSISGHDFREWAQVLDWILQNLFGLAPLLEGHRETQERITSPDLNWLRDVALAVEKDDYLETELRAHEILDIIEIANVEIPGMTESDNLDDEQTRQKILRAIGKRLTKCIRGDTVRVDTFTVERLEVPDPQYRTTHAYRFSRDPAIPRNDPAMDPAIKPRDPANPAMTSEHFYGADLCANKEFETHCGDSGVCGVDPTSGAFQQEGADAPNAPGATSSATPFGSEGQSFPPSTLPTDAVSSPLDATNGAESIPIEEDFDRI